MRRSLEERSLVCSEHRKLDDEKDDETEVEIDSVELQRLLRLLTSLTLLPRELRDLLMLLSLLRDSVRSENYFSIHHAIMIFYIKREKKKSKRIWIFERDVLHVTTFFLSVFFFSYLIKLPKNRQRVGSKVKKRFC